MRSNALAVAALLLLGCGAAHSLDAGADGGGRRDAAARDAGHERDAAASDAGANDAGPSDASAPIDAGADASTPIDASASADGGGCNPDAVRFLYLASGPLEVGTFCDAIHVCATSPAEVSRVEAASADFDCGDTPEPPCEGRTCTYDPATIDEAELAEVCAVTLVTPAPDIVCVVWGP